MLAERLGARLGQAVVVENRGGAAGVIAAELASRAEPDGYSLFFASIGTASINPSLHAKLSYRPEDLLPVALFADLPNVIVVRGDSPWKTLADMLAEAREKPRGAGLFLLGQRQQPASVGRDAEGGCRGRHPACPLPRRRRHRQPAHGRADRSRGEQPALGHHPAARRAAAGAGGDEPGPLPALPDVPTVAESGIPGLASYAATAWFGLQVPRGTPAAIIERLNAEVNAICAEPQARERVEQLGARMRGGSVCGIHRICSGREREMGGGDPPLRREGGLNRRADRHAERNREKHQAMLTRRATLAATAGLLATPAIAQTAAWPTAPSA